MNKYASKKDFISVDGRYQVQKPLNDGTKSGPTRITIDAQTKELGSSSSSDMDSSSEEEPVPDESSSMSHSTRLITGKSRKLDMAVK